MIWYCRGRFHRRKKKGKLENVTTWSHFPIYVNYLTFAQQQWLREACVLLVKQGDKPQLSLKSGKTPIASVASGFRFVRTLGFKDASPVVLLEQTRKNTFYKMPLRAACCASTLAKTYHLWDHFSVLWSSLPTKPTVLCTSVLLITHREEALLALWKVTWLRGMYTEKSMLIGKGGVVPSLLAAHVQPCLQLLQHWVQPWERGTQAWSCWKHKYAQVEEGHGWPLKQSTELSSSSTEIAFPPYQEKERMSLQQM